MSLLELVFRDTKLARIGIVRLDVSEEETHSMENQVTDHPVEQGVNIVDHIRALPDGIEIRGQVTDTPIYILAGLRAPSPIDGGLPTTERVGKALDEFERIMKEKELVEVVTTLKTYENMALESFRATRNSRLGNTLSVVLRLKEVRIAVADELAIPDPEDAANAAVQDKGKKPTKPATTPQAAGAEGSSVIYDGLGLEKFPAQAAVF